MVRAVAGEVETGIVHPLDQPRRPWHGAEIENIGYPEAQILDVEPQACGHVVQVDAEVTQAADLERAGQANALDIIVTLAEGHLAVTPRQPCARGTVQPRRNA